MIFIFLLIKRNRRRLFNNFLILYNIVFLIQALLINRILEFYLYVYRTIFFFLIVVPFLNFPEFSILTFQKLRFFFKINILYIFLNILLTLISVDRIILSKDVSHIFIYGIKSLFSDFRPLRYFLKLIFHVINMDLVLNLIFNVLQTTYVQIFDHVLFNFSRR